jgi:ABC-type sugar transport system ATPase subunit
MAEMPLLSASNLSVRYGATTALEDVTVDVRGGEVHALVGENGAGKSTLLRVLAGAEVPDAGHYTLAAGARMAWVPQEAVLPADLDAAAWIFLGDEQRGPLRLLRRRAMRAAAGEALRAIGCHADPRARVGSLTASQRKQVQLARALRRDADVLLLDEPTAVLGAGDAGQLFTAMRRLAARGSAIVYVSHRLQEVLGLADRVTVLRDGRRVATHAADKVSVADLVRDMVGGRGAAADNGGARRAARAPRADAPPVLRVHDLAVGHVRGVSLALHAGEILGVAGLVGSGRSAVLEGLARLRRLRSGTVAATTAPILVPEDRLRNGLVSALCLRENLFLPAPGWWLRARAERLQSVEWIERLAIRTSGSEAAVASLSGGNQQKLLLARALRHRPALLLLDEPTAGVDVGAKAEIHAAISELAAAGSAVLLASSDLPELFALCDRIVVLYRGTCAGIVTVSETSEEEVAALLTGAPRSA